MSKSTLETAVVLTGDARCGWIDPAARALQACGPLPSAPLHALVATQKAQSPEQTPDNPAGNAVDFERALAELESIVEKLEAGDLTLDESLKHFERGVQLTRACQAALKQAEQKVEILMRKSGTGDFETAPFAANEDPDA
jgi:exodeoxyribonuclease VII small subunit